MFSMNFNALILKINYFNIFLNKIYIFKNTQYLDIKYTIDSANLTKLFKQ